MLLHTSPGPAPNPRRVAIALAEKGVVWPVARLSLVRREQKAPAYLAKNPRGQVPALEFDDGEVLTESIAIARWLDAEHPEPPLFGRDPRETARIEMWLRRVELALMPPLTAVWMHDHPFTAAVVVPQYQDYGASNRARYLDTLRWFDAQLGDRPHLAGDAFTIADIALLTTVDFGAWVGLPIPQECATLRAWHARAAARPSCAANGPGTGHGW